MEEDIKIVKEIKKEFITKMIKDITHNDNQICYRNIHALQNILNELERLQNENEALIADNLEYQRIQDIFDKRTYRKKYLEERRKEQPNLLYPDADEIYKRYYELKRENENLKTLHINIQGMRNGKELLNKYITDSIPKPIIRGKINTLEMEEHYDYIDNKKAISVLKELLGE